VALINPLSVHTIMASSSPPSIIRSPHYCLTSRQITNHHLAHNVTHTDPSTHGKTHRSTPVDHKADFYVVMRLAPQHTMIVLCYGVTDDAEVSWLFQLYMDAIIAGRSGSTGVMIISSSSSSSIVDDSGRRLTRW
jgi:hypothetical protein